MTQKSVLIVDDNEYWCQLLAELLHDEFKVVQAFSRMEALAKLWQEIPKFHAAVIDVRLVDTDLKDKSGLDLIPWLNTRGEYTSSIVITALNNTSIMREAFINSDISDFLIKGLEFNNNEFRQAVREAVRKAEDIRRADQEINLKEELNQPLLIFDRKKFYKKFLEAFNEDELVELGFRLDIRIGNLGGTTFKNKVINLIEYCERRNILHKLVRECFKARPNTDWI